MAVQGSVGTGSTPSRGLEPDADCENVKASWSSALQGFQGRHFEVYVIPGIAPFPQVDHRAQTSEPRIFWMTKEEFEANPEAQGLVSIRGRQLGIIPAGISGEGVVNTEDVYTLGAVVGVTARADLDEDLVYGIIRTYRKRRRTPSRHIRGLVTSRLNMQCRIAA